MKILIYRYGSICEPDITASFKKLGLEVIETRPRDKASPQGDSAVIDTLSPLFDRERFLFVFTVNFFPVISVRLLYLRKRRYNQTGFFR